MSACPRYSCSVRSGTPAAASVVANVCRRSWKRIARTSAATHASWKRRVTLVRSSGVPSSGCANTRSSSSPKTVRRRHRLQLAGEPVRHRHRARGAEVGLALAGVLVANPRVADPDLLGAEVDVLPVQAEKFGLAQPGRRRGEDDEPEYRAERVAVDGGSGIAAITAIQRRQRQELQVGIRVAFPPPPGRAARATGLAAPTPSPRRAQKRSAGRS